MTHVLHGVIFFLVLRGLFPSIASRTRFLIAVIIESGWEVLENSPLIIDRYRSVTVSLGYYGDSIANSIVGYRLLRCWLSDCAEFGLALVLGADCGRRIVLVGHDPRLSHVERDHAGQAD